MFLAVTPLREFWDPADELLFAGLWCVPYDRRGELHGLRHRFLPDPWRDGARYAAAVNRCGEFSARLLDQMAPYLNRAHGVSRSRRYWSILLNPWLTHHIQQLFSHFSHVEDAFALEPGLRTVVLDPAEYRTPKDTLDFVQASLEDRYQLQLFSILLEAKRAGWPTRACPDSVRRKSMGAPPDPGLGRRAAAGALAWLTPPGMGAVLADELNIRRSEKPAIYLGSRFKALPWLTKLPAGLRTDAVADERRRGLASLDGKDAFEKAVIAALPVHFPSLWLEGWAAARRHCAGGLWRRPRVVFSAVGWHYNEAFKFAAAECAEDGSELWGLQHGGTYGMFEQSDTEYFERSITDRYYAWGWAELSKDPKVRDLPHPVLSRVVEPADSEDLVLVAVALDYYDLRLARPHRGQAALDYIDRQARLWRACAAAAPGKAVYRTNPTDWGWRHDDRLRDLCPDIRFDGGGVPFTERARGARLLVFDNPSTTFLEAMGADVPCVSSWDPDAWPFRPEVRPFIERLRAAGLVFDEPEAAGREAAMAYADPRGWWDEPKRREAHREFARRFALADAGWAERWLAEIRAA